MTHKEIESISRLYPVNSFESIELNIEGIICDLDQLPRSEIKIQLDLIKDSIADLNNYYSSMNQVDFNYRTFLHNFEKVL